MYVKTAVPVQRAGLGFLSTAPEFDPARVLSETVAQSTGRVGNAALFGLAILAGVAVVVARAGR